MRNASVGRPAFEWVRTCGGAVKRGGLGSVCGASGLKMLEHGGPSCPHPDAHAGSRTCDGFAAAGQGMSFSFTTEACVVSANGEERFSMDHRGNKAGSRSTRKNSSRLARRSVLALGITSTSPGSSGVAGA